MGDYFNPWRVVTLVAVGWGGAVDSEKVDVEKATTLIRQGLEANLITVNREEFSEQGVVVVTPTDELLTAEVIREIQASIDLPAAKHIIIDLRSTRFLVSASLFPNAEPITPLLKLHQKLRHNSRRLVLCNLGSEIAEVFRITRLDQLFEVKPDLTTALSDVGSVNAG